MTPLQLQRELVTELKQLFQNFFLPTPQKDAEGKPIVSTPHIYTQWLPIASVNLNGESEEEFFTMEEPEEPFPYIIVRLMEGMVDAETEVYPKHITDIVLIIGVYDETEERGHEDILIMIQRIYEHFAKNPILAKKYRHVGEFQYALEGEHFWPKYMGFIYMQWQSKIIHPDRKGE